MSSLPAGWHGIAAPSKTGIPGSQGTMFTSNIRKKWQSPQSAELPKSKLPSYRKSSMPPIPSASRSRIPNSKSSNTTTTSAQKSKLPECPTQSSLKLKELQNEVTSLKKELSTIKAENSVLKARVRRLDDENNQKARQIEKLRAEIKNDAVNSKRNRESESVLLLRQKCLRLEGALKEKDFALKKLIGEIKSVKVDEIKDIVESYHRELGNNNGISNSLFRNRKFAQPLNDGKPATAKQGKNNIKDQVSKTEVVKLRDMLHKLQEENSSLQQQIKEKDQEIRQLKLHIYRQVPKTPVSSTTQTWKTTQSLPKVNSSSLKKVPTLNSVSSKEKLSSSSHTVMNKTFKTPSSSKPITKTIAQPKQVKVKPSLLPSVAPAKPNSTFVVNRVKGELKQKTHVNRLKSNAKIAPTVDKDMELRVQHMRENVAARKIQRSWRNHRNHVIYKDSSQEQEKAVLFIDSALREHKLHKDTLDHFVNKDNFPLKLTDDEVLIIVQEVNTAVKKVWNDSTE